MFIKSRSKSNFQDKNVYLHKFCPTHKFEKVLISTDIEYYKKQRNFLKPGQMPVKFNTPVEHGCPYDCGLCTDHEQHSCLTLLEITDNCNLTCPICYAESSPKLLHRSLEQIEFMLNKIIENEGEPDIVQISGGEPTIHPDFFKILDLCKSRPIKHLMINTNGIRIAQEPEFVKQLANYMPGFEIYLQFDSFKVEAHLTLRGADLRNIRLKAIENLNKYNISTNLVVTLVKGLNDDEIGDIIKFAIKQKCVRGITFQPVQIAGRTEDFNPATDRLTLSEVRQNILDQSNVFKSNDIIPVPCHPDCLAMAYALKLGGDVIPLTSLIPDDVWLGVEGNTIVYEQNDDIKDHLFKLFSTSHSPISASLSLRQLLCCIPFVKAPENIGYDNLFRIIIMQFLDPYNFDVRSVKRSCVHIVHPNGKIIPFDTYNIFYREGKESILQPHQIELPNS